MKHLTTDLRLCLFINFPFSLGISPVKVATTPSSLECFASTLAGFKSSSTSIVSIPVNRCNSIDMRLGKPNTKAIFTVYSRPYPSYPTNPSSRLISAANTHPLILQSRRLSSVCYRLQRNPQKTPSSVLSRCSQHQTGLPSPSR